MDCSKVGLIIQALRKGKGLTQRQLAEQLCVTDKAVSKWERGLGCPDLSILPQLTEILGVDLRSLLQGALEKEAVLGGNMKKVAFYVCPDCGNILTATGNAQISCCGIMLKPLEDVNSEGKHMLSVEESDGEWYVTCPHAMDKGHHISFVAFVTGDKLFMFKQYAEQDLQVRMRRYGKGKLYFYCNTHGLYSQSI